MNHALHYHMAGWTLPHCAKNVTRSLLGFNSNHQKKDSTSHFEQRYLTPASLRIGRSVNYRHEISGTRAKGRAAQETKATCNAW